MFKLLAGLSQSYIPNPVEWWHQVSWSPSGRSGWSVMSSNYKGYIHSRCWLSGNSLYIWYILKAGQYQAMLQANWQCCCLSGKDAAYLEMLLAIWQCCYLICWMSIMLSVHHSECPSFWVSIILSVPHAGNVAGYMTMLLAIWQCYWLYGNAALYILKAGQYLAMLQANWQCCCLSGNAAWLFGNAAWLSGNAAWLSGNAA